jgi:hypothetical protein
MLISITGPQQSANSCEKGVRSSAVLFISVCLSLASLAASLCIQYNVPVCKAALADLVSFFQAITKKYT